MNKAYLTNIFSSIQGEGIYIGEKQLFIRFSECNLDCPYCDTKESWSEQPEYRLTIKEKDIDMVMQNPLSPEALEAIIDEHIDKSYHGISLTGGEPLLRIDFLLEFLPLLEKREYKILLETNGTLPFNLKKIIHLVDIVSADVKYSIFPELREVQLEFFRIMKERENYIKILLENQTVLGSYEDILMDIKGVNEGTSIILQPVWGEEVDIFKFYNLAKKYFENVKFIPQMHKYIKID